MASLQLNLWPSPKRDRDPDDKIPAKTTVTITGIFGHQIAGHGALLKGENGIVCKPFIPQEWAFYRSLANHPGYKEWTSHIYGVVEIRQENLAVWAKEISKLESHQSMMKNKWNQQIFGHLTRQINNHKNGSTEHVHRT